MYSITLFVLLGIAVFILMLERIVVRPIRLRLAEHAGAIAGRPPFLVDYARGLFWLLVLVLIMRFFIIQPIHIKSNGMQPELSRGDFSILARYAYGLESPFSESSWWRWAEPQIGDMVAAFDQRLLIRKVVALPGDEITQLHEVLYVNGEAVSGVKLPTGQKRADQYFVPAGHVLLAANEFKGITLVPSAAIFGRVSTAFWHFGD
ncbi:signal peptidase I [Piscirickettsia litoralis]|uniref:Signal peptidase I n=1 Tax=Piscirickettsia litoralis TaxID=1891921 RepID=A0ABX3A0V9_9GAMM|nr:signal peptidase I [Piscirickettsia litoralis]ODN42511.1 signal peptidase I [Piscirickettsia litoralis]